MIRLSSSRRFDMKSCLLHRVTKLAKLQLGPITVMKVVQQHNNTNSRKDKKRKRLHLSPLLLLLLPSLLPTAQNSRKRKRMEIQNTHHEIRTLLFLALFARPLPPDFLERSRQFTHTRRECPPAATTRPAPSPYPLP